MAKPFEDDDEDEFLITSVTATCSCCGRKETYNLDKEEQKKIARYALEGREMGYIQEIFPKIPAWIRSGAIDQFSGGFCVCPECSGMEV